MTGIIDTTSKRRLSTKLAAGIAISAMLALGTLTGSASAEEGGYYQSWNGGGYYNAPPVVYGSPYGSSYYGSSPYYAPPVVYGPSFGVSLPFVNLNIR
jgi:hypothetical protein